MNGRGVEEWVEPILPFLEGQKALIGPLGIDV